MNFIRLAIERPIAIMAAVLMIVIFGLVALKTIPTQLTPDIRKPVISVRTAWPGAAPAEVEREIVNRQEEVFRGIEGLESISSRSRDGQANVTLEFNINQDMNRALLLVANRLDRVSGYPDQVKEPTLDTAGSEDRAIAWFTLSRLPGNTRDIRTYRDFVEDTVQDRLERVPGVSFVNVFGGTSSEMEVVVDPARMARYGLTVPAVVRALRGANSSASAGDVEEGKRRYVVRTEGEITTIEQAKAVVLRSIGEIGSGRVARVTVGDVADVRFGFKQGLAFDDAIVAATRHRIRPIFMSTLTSIFGMLPLVLFPGAGSELYRGLGSVVVGGLALSSLLTLTIIPPLLGFVVGPLEAKRARREDGS